MSVAYLRVLPVPVLIEKQTEMAAGAQPCERVKEKAQQRGRGLAQSGIRPHTQQIGVRLDDVQMCVHRLARVVIFGAQAHVGYRRPVAAGCLHIAAAHPVAAVLLYVAEHPLRIIERFGIASRGTGVLAEPVNGKSYGIELLFSVEGVPSAFRLQNTPPYSWS